MVFVASQLQLKRMFKKDALKKTEHLEVQGKERELTLGEASTPATTTSSTVPLFG